MEVKDLAKIVGEMRHAQVEYFRTKSPSALQQAKALEAKVDRVLLSLADRQETLF